MNEKKNRLLNSYYKYNYLGKFNNVMINNNYKYIVTLAIRVC